MQSHPRVVAIIAAYNEEDVVEDVVRALVDDGIDVYFIDNGSTDATVARVQPFVGRGVLNIERFPDRDGVPEDGFPWEQILTRKESIARELEADWFIHHDADEFRESPWSDLSLKEGIARVDTAGYNAIDFQLLNFWPTANDADSEPDVRRRLQYCEPGETWNRVQIKCWKNTGQPVRLTASGGHSAEFAGRHIFPIRFLLRHYPIRSQAHGERKVFRERLPRFVGTERARGWHVQYDGLQPGASFVRDAAALTRFNAETVRLGLLIRHREVERLERTLAANQDAADQYAAQSASLRDRLAQQDAELAELRPHLAAQDEELARLRAAFTTWEAERDRLHVHLASQDEELARLRSGFTVWEEERARLHVHLSNQDEELARLRPLFATLEEAVAKTETLQSALDAAEARHAEVLASASWRLTAPMRAVRRIWRR